MDPNPPPPPDCNMVIINKNDGGINIMQHQEEDYQEDHHSSSSMSVNTETALFVTESTTDQPKATSLGNINDNIKNSCRRDLRYWILLVITYAALVVGSVSSSLLSRFYFIHGGSSRWVSVQSAGFTILLIPMLFNKDHNKPWPFSSFTLKLLLISIGIGLMLGVNNLLFSWGVSYLPVSTASLLLSTQLAFNLILSVIIVKQKVTFKNLNCVVLLTLSSVLLALTHSHDRPEGVSQKQYFLGFFSILGAGLLFALYLPLVDMIYSRNVKSYQLVMEMQFVTELAATVLATVGMLADGGFGEMKRESVSGFNLGTASYWLTIGFTIFCWQFTFMGTAGLVFLTTSLNSGICMTAILSMNVVGGVLAYGDSFGGAKAISTVLCVWGFSSYLYGEYIKMKDCKKKSLLEEEDGDIGEENRIEMKPMNHNQDSRNCFN
ncbi:probable purine permease 4 isoform X1 [Papaver somniferum]|uniref:probable purine permease 4 isoform X1 n=2 Tax=Papaver somniferum TaxID=3469 RepID=UPI000E6F8B40|nr:probable purine permease 4 isoform X1 [Papaver somniferum]